MSAILTVHFVIKIDIMCNYPTPAPAGRHHCACALGWDSVTVPETQGIPFESSTEEEVRSERAKSGIKKASLEACLRESQGLWETLLFLVAE